jgi:hypothetical protein
MTIIDDKSLEQKLNIKLLLTLDKNATDIYKCYSKFMEWEANEKTEFLCALAISRQKGRHNKGDRSDQVTTSRTDPDVEKVTDFRRQQKWTRTEKLWDSFWPKVRIF